MLPSRGLDGLLVCRLGTLFLQAGGMPCSALWFGRLHRGLSGAPSGESLLGDDSIRHRVPRSAQVTDRARSYPTTGADVRLDRNRRHSRERRVVWGSVAPSSSRMLARRHSCIACAPPPRRHRQVPHPTWHPPRRPAWLRPSGAQQLRSWWLIVRLASRPRGRPSPPRPSPWPPAQHQRLPQQPLRRPLDHDGRRRRHVPIRASASRRQPSSLRPNRRRSGLPRRLRDRSRSLQAAALVEGQ